MIVYIVEEEFYEPDICGVYTTEEKAREAINKKIIETGKKEFTIRPYRVDGELCNSAALWFVHKTIEGNCFSDPAELDPGDYPIDEAWIEEKAFGGYSYNMILWAYDRQDAEYLAQVAFANKAKELGI